MNPKLYPKIYFVSENIKHNKSIKFMVAFKFFHDSKKLDNNSAQIFIILNTIS